jgi:2,3,4,5-tetrahydropyridine-2,6-dicarboxylate N-succinyltransferase
MNQNIIIQLFENSQQPGFTFSEDDKKVVRAVIEQLDQGNIRVCEKKNNIWITNEWIKKAILLLFKISNNKNFEISADINFYDKLSLKKWSQAQGVRVVPPAVARSGSFIEPGVILMPSFVNIGAYIESGTMVDTWATVGSCAQIGKNVHLSGGVGIGGVLEPLQAQPVIIEDDCFIGSRCIVVEGVHLESGVVLGAGVTITSSTKIIDVSGPTAEIFKGRVPANSVVVPGTEMKTFPAGSYGVNAALIIGKRKESTNKKTSLNDVLRDFSISV